VVLAEDVREAEVVIPQRIRGGGRDDVVIFRVCFACLIGWIGIISGAIPGTEN